MFFYVYIRLIVIIHIFKEMVEIKDKHKEYNKKQNFIKDSIRDIY